jgi:hypothetical protein
MMEVVGPIPDVSIVVPCYNERARLPETLTRLRAYIDARAELFEILIVDNGSTDATAAVATELLRPIGRAGVVLANLDNRGKGAAVRQGMLAARGRVVLFTDADLSGGVVNAVGARATELALLKVKLPRVPETIPHLHFSEALELIFHATGEDARRRPELLVVAAEGALLSAPSAAPQGHGFRSTASEHWPTSPGTGARASSDPRLP